MPLGHLAMTPEGVGLIAIAVIAAALALLGLLLWRRERAATQRLQAQLEEARAEQGQQAVALAQARERAERLPGLEQSTEALRGELSALRGDYARLETRAQAEREAAAEKLKLLEQAKAELSQQFKVLANEIFDDKSARFVKQNQEQLGGLLDPLRQRLGEFQHKVEQYYDNEGKQRSALAEKLEGLSRLNRTLSEDAQALTRALKGESKTQGNWGEMVLERILESLGLARGREYEVQVSHTVDGRRLQPDVVIHLPDERHIVVDAKVSLTDWEAACRAETEAERAEALRRHRQSLRQHIQGLAAKNYQDLYALDSLDCVVMFVPVEPALLSVVSEDSQLFQQAWEQQVLLVSASTLFFALRMVAFLWRQDAQNRNAQEIARRGAELYDKLRGFVEEIDKVGDSLERAQRSYATAVGRLHQGKGNVIRQAEMLRELGIKPKKTLPPNWQERAADADADAGEGAQALTAPADEAGADDEPGASGP